MCLIMNGREGTVPHQPSCSPMEGEGDGGGGGGKRGMCIVMNGRVGTTSHQPSCSPIEGDGGGGEVRKMCVVMNGREGTVPYQPSFEAFSSSSSSPSSVFPPEHPFHRLRGNSPPVQVCERERKEKEKKMGEERKRLFDTNFYNTDLYYLLSFCFFGSF